ncbi:MAG: hypothetical protein ACWGQW_03355 [bacterium]
MNTEARDSLIGYIWDAYKDVNGIRPRWINFDAMSDQDLEDLADSLERDIQEECQREEREVEALEAARKDINGYVWLSSYGETYLEYEGRVPEKNPSCWEWAILSGAPKVTLAQVWGGVK